MIITLLRKPLEGSVAENTLKHGCGAININATRVDGRWPANFILIHKEDCELKGTKKVKGHKGYPNGPGGIWSKKYQEEHQKDRSLTDVKTVKDNEAWVGHADEDGKETVADWACVESCPVKELQGYKEGYNDDGGASRFFKQFTEEAKTWDGWGTALKPAWEPVCIGVKK
jgi:hypothetical protein